MHFDLFEEEGIQAAYSALIPGLRSHKRIKSVLKTALAKTPKSGSILEFGVFRGKTINYLAKLLPREPIYGFDSFEGFPNDGRTDWQSDFTVDTLPTVAPNVTLVKGFFDTSLPIFLKENPSLAPLRLLHIDCDLYSSTKIIFDNLSHLLMPGSAIVFDELLHYGRFRENEFLAFFEFLEQKQMTFRWSARSGKLMPLEKFLETKTTRILLGMKVWRSEGYHQNAAVVLAARPVSYEDTLAQYRGLAETLAQTFPMEID
jgi:hypothetical protein